MSLPSALDAREPVVHSCDDRPPTGTRAASSPVRCMKTTPPARLILRELRFEPRPVRHAFGPSSSSASHLTQPPCPTVSGRKRLGHTTTRGERVREGSDSRGAVAKRLGCFDKELERIGRLPLIIVDEVRVPFDPETAALSFVRVSSRHERSSIVMSSKKACSGWAVILGDPIAVAALVDRLVHHAEVLVLRVDGDRLKGKAVLQRKVNGWR